MKTQHRLIFAAALLAAVSLCVAQTSGERKKANPATTKAGAGHVMVNTEEVNWGPPPPSVPAGAQAAVLAGDPSQAGTPYTIRIKAPDGYRVPPHWHPVDENVVVLQGVMMLGMGEKFNPARGHELRVGGYVKMPKEVRHFAWFKGESIFQVHGIGPFEVIYVNPADDPRNKPAPK